jgi:phage terminase small subunit
MANNPTTKHYSLSVREQKFACLYAQGIHATEAARKAGYSENSALKKSYQLVRKPKIQALIQQYRHSLGVLNAEVLELCLSTLTQIVNDNKAHAKVRFAAIREVLKFYSEYRHGQFSSLGEISYPAYPVTTNFNSSK